MSTSETVAETAELMYRLDVQTTKVSIIVDMIVSCRYASTVLV